MSKFDLASWTKEFFSQKQNPMSETESRIFLASVLGSGPIPKPVASTFQYRLGLKRVEYMNLEYDPHALVFVCLMSATPATIVMYLSAFKCDGMKLTMDNITSKFPHGFPSQDNLGLMWDKQKGVDVDNELDSIAWSKS